MIDINGDTQTLITSMSNISLGEAYDKVHKFIMDTSKTFTAGVVFEELYVNIYNYAYNSKTKTPGKGKEGYRGKGIRSIEKAGLEGLLFLWKFHWNNHSVL